MSVDALIGFLVFWGLILVVSLVLTYRIGLDDGRQGKYWNESVILRGLYDKGYNRGMKERSND